MQWDADVNAGFSTGQALAAGAPGLPAAQRGQASRRTRVRCSTSPKKLLSLRKEYPALHAGDYTALERRGKVLAYLRSTAGQTVLVAINFDGRAAEFIPPDGKWRVIFGVDGDAAEAVLAPHEVRLMVKE